MAPRYSRRRGLHLGADLETGKPLWLGDQWMRTGVHILGRTGSGKTRLALDFFAQLAADDTAATVLISPKGDLAPMARDYAIAHGLGRRVVVFDPANREHVIGYNPLKPNGVDPFAQAHSVRQAILAGHGQTSIDHTQQLGRMLMIALAAARLLELSFLEACELLRSDSSIRATVLAHISDPVLARALAYFDQLRAGRQDELAASALARLEAFTTFPILREIVSQQAHSLDLGEIMRERMILIINLEVERPLPLDDVRLVGRLLINDLLSHAFARPKGERSPVRLIIDEAHVFATPMLSYALNMGRELGLVPILAHQELEQLILDDESRKLYAAVMNDTLVKVVSGSTTIEDLKKLADTLFLDTFDPKSVKDELTSLELDPFVDWARSRTYTRNWSSGTTNTATRSRSAMLSRSRTVGHSRTHSHTETESYSESSGESDVSADSSGSSDSQSFAFDNDGNWFAATMHGPTSGSQTTHGSTRSETSSYATSNGESETESESQSAGEAESLGESLSNGAVETGGGSESYTLAPTIAYEKRRVVSSRSFWTYDEHILGKLQGAGRLGVGEFIVKVPGKAARFFRAPFVRDPFVPERQRSAALERMHALPFYSSSHGIAVEAESRRERLVQLGLKPSVQTQASPTPLPVLNDAWDIEIPRGRAPRRK